VCVHLMKLPIEHSRPTVLVTVVLIKNMGSRAVGNV